jgi:zinc D-Ala-D-Ala dipeptidase
MGHIEQENLGLPSITINPKGDLPPILEKSVEGWKKISVDKEDPRYPERLVPVGAFSEFSFCDTSGVYFGERGKNPEEINFLGQPVNRDASLITHFVREGVLERLKISQNSMPRGYFFAFYDNFRPLDVQQALYDSQREKFKTEHSEWDEETLERETQRFVSIPAPNEDTGSTHPSPHSTGGVVDLTIIKMSEEGLGDLQDLINSKREGNLQYPISKEEEDDFKYVNNWIKKQDWSKEKKQYVMKNWLIEYRYSKEKARIFKEQAQPLNMGTKFDDFSEVAKTTYYENIGRELTPEEEKVRQNRRFLYKVMTDAGFENYPDEWWHFSFGDNMWAKLSGNQSAFYGGFPNLPKYCKDIENMRRAVYTQQKSDFSSSKEDLFTNIPATDPTEI